MAFTFLTAALGLGALIEARVPARRQDEPCTVLPVGGDSDDVPNILDAVENCGNGGTISLPADNVYNINQRMTTHLEGATLEIGGTLRFSDDIDYWTDNAYRFDYQEQSTAWRVTGSDYVVDGGDDMGGIDGNGQAWYTYNEGEGNRFGRPMPLHIVNSTRATFRNLSILQPQFWAVLVDSSSYIELDNFYVNATDFDNDAEEDGTNWVVNTDGIDTYRSDHITITNWLYQGGDDCVAFKGNSTNIHVENFVAYGGPGVAFGSLGQYPDRYDIVENITIKNVQVQPSPQYTTRGSIYFKAWIGEEQGDPPNGGGGGGGYVRNVTVENFEMKDVDLGPYINTCLSYSGDPTDYCDTSTFTFSDMHFKNVTGSTKAKSTGYPGEDISFAISLICSAEAPCENLTFEDIDIELPDDFDGSEYLCANADVEGLDCEEFTRDDDDDDDDDDDE